MLPGHGYREGVPGIHQSSLDSSCGDRDVHSPSANLRDRPVLRRGEHSVRPVVRVGALRVLRTVSPCGVQTLA